MRLKLPSWFSNNNKVLLSKISELENRVKEFDPRYGIDINPFAKKAGEDVTLSTAIALDTVYACIRDKSESIGQLPMIVKRGKVKLDESHREYRILAQKPNDYMTTQDLVEMIVTCLEARGNFYMIPIRNRYGRIAEFLPLRWQENVVTRMNEYGRVVHTYVMNDGKQNIEFAGDQLIHIKLNSGSGIIGMSPIMTNAMTVGISISQENYLSSLMGNSAMPKGILYTDAVFKDGNALNRIRDQWAEMFGGSKNSGKTPILENGTKYQVTGLSPADTELIKQRTHSKISLCAIFRVPPSRLGIIEAARYNNPEQNNRAYLSASLIPIITKIEMAFNIALQGTVKVKFDTMQFLRGDRVSQVEALKGEFSTGAISHNEMRVDLGRDEIEGGDYHAIDTNNFTFGMLTDIPKLQEQARQMAQQPSQPSVEDESNDE